MADLISRAYVLAEYDRQHQGPPGGARKIMEDAPAIDAIPMEWLESKRKEALHEGMRPDEVEGVEMVLWMWQKEQEART